MAKKFGFTSGFASTYRDAAHEALMQTMRDLAEQPERKQNIAASQQSVAASKSTQAREDEQAAYDKTQRPQKEKKAAADISLTDAKALMLGQQHQKLMEAPFMKAEDLVREQANIASDISKATVGLNGIITPIDPEELQRKRDEYNFYGRLIKERATKGQAPGAPAPAAAAAGGTKTTPVVPGGGSDQYGSADDVRAAVQSQKISPQDGAKIMLEKFSDHPALR